MHRKKTLSGFLVKSIVVLFISIFFLTALCFTTGCLGKQDSSFSVIDYPAPSSSFQNFTDSKGHIVAVKVPATRIVALNSNTGELLAGIGAGDTVVGLASPAFTARPWLLSKFNSPAPVGSWSEPNCEKILELRPDVVIAYSNSKNLDKLSMGNIPVLYLDVDNATETIPAIRTMGVITGKTKRAEELAHFYQKYYDLVEERTKSIPEKQKPSVYMEMYSDYVAVMPGSASDHIIQIAGGRNIVQGVASGDYPVISKEFVIQNNPDVIIRTVNTANTENNPEIDLVPVYTSVLSRDGYESVKAISGNDVYIITGEMLYGPRSIAGVIALAKIFHPDKFNDMDPEQVLDEYSEKFLPEAKKGNARLYPSI